MKRKRNQPPPPATEQADFTTLPEPASRPTPSADDGEVLLEVGETTPSALTDHPGDERTVRLHYRDGHCEAGYHLEPVNAWLARAPGTARFCPLPPDHEVVGWSELHVE